MTLMSFPTIISQKSMNNKPPNSDFFQDGIIDEAWYLTPVTLGLERLRQGEYVEFNTSLGQFGLQS